MADYYERALFNHILSSQHPETGHVIYNLSLEMGGYKAYQNPFCLYLLCRNGDGKSCKISLVYLLSQRQ